ncbi:galactose oxidase/kelch repeat superfamily protein [Striga asiatica]|uniref:Galactose oxidase/kelch repeat superfamily protein n=1 Tax=Striga asiatica TaxID=4170 RepID=A0A5A7Q2Z5_STRAF|nr:galactose oxidase/kelch repeat superfamily protein [Striga asiatica]
MRKTSSFWLCKLSSKIVGKLRGGCWWSLVECALVYVLGGIDDKQYFNDIWVLDINTSFWARLNISGSVHAWHLEITIGPISFSHDDDLSPTYNELEAARRAAPIPEPSFECSTLMLFATSFPSNSCNTPRTPAAASRAPRVAMMWQRRTTALLVFKEVWDI